MLDKGEGVKYTLDMEETHMTDKQKKELELAATQSSQWDALSREMELTHCPNCGEPYDLEPCNARHARIQQDRLRVTPSLGVSLKAILNTVPKKQMQPWKIYKNGDKESRMTVDATDEKDALRVFGNSVGLILTNAYRAYPAKNAGE
jgi:hypothetical protein